MKLSELDARLHGTLTDGHINFMCPHPGCSHMVHVPVSAAPAFNRPLVPEQRTPGGKIKTEHVWQASGEFPETVTLAPSVDIIEADAEGNKIRTLCWHGWVQNGTVT